MPKPWYRRAIEATAAWLLHLVRNDIERFYTHEFLTDWFVTDKKKVQDRQRLNKIIDKHAKTMKTHFKKDGYDLDADYLLEDVIQEFMGYDLQGYIKGELARKSKVDYTVYEPRPTGKRFTRRYRDSKGKIAI
jgi:hypothetical protein